MKYIIILITTLLLISCDTTEITKRKTYPVIDGINNGRDIDNITHIRLYVIDSCEYIGDVNGSYTDFLTHKGNCKFCINRNKNGNWN